MGKFETGASCARVNDIVLTVINDGNGNQCGMTYAQRCDAVNSINKYRTACRHYAATATNAHIEESAKLIQEYYKEHIKN